MSLDVFIVHIPKKRLWLKIDTILTERGYSWDGASARNCWRFFGKNSCVFIDNETRKLTFGNKKHYKAQSHLIFTAKDFLIMYNNSHGFFGTIRLFILGIVLKLRRKEVR